LDLTYADGTSYVFREYQNVIFSARPLPDAFASRLEDAFATSGMGRPSVL
jgi:hypothetical protein